MHDALMDTPADRLKMIRLEKFPTAADAAEAMKVAYPTYAGHENGTRGLTRKAAVRYCGFFRVSLDWLLTGKGVPRKGQKDPILSIYDGLSAQDQRQAINFLEYLRNRPPDG